MTKSEQKRASAEEQSVLLTDDTGPVRILTFNRAEAHNAVSAELMTVLGTALASAAQDEAVGSVVLTGSGRMFSAGGDLDRMSAERTAQAKADEVARLAECLNVIRALTEFPKPTIAMINGPVAGAGLALALGCAVRMASEQARFVYAYGRVGLAGDFGVNWLLGRLLGPGRALSFALSPSWTAVDALRGGLVDAVATPDELSEATLVRGRQLAEIPVSAYAQIRRNLEASSLPFAAGTSVEAEAFHAMRDTEEHRAAVATLIERTRNRQRN